MQYISSVERIGIAKGIEVGIEQGRLEGEARLLKRQLERRFGELPDWAVDKLQRAAEQDLESWSEAVLSAVSMEAVFESKAAH